MLTIQEQVPASDMTSEAEAWPRKDLVKRCISSDFILEFKNIDFFYRHKQSSKKILLRSPKPSRPPGIPGYLGSWPPYQNSTPARPLLFIGLLT
ncbi:MAG: hypothetical protein KIS77_13320 [Saprospiraceae bacterium]|nr:hypothetical protein [Saprospiraceae bacterium]